MVDICKEGTTSLNPSLPFAYVFHSHVFTGILSKLTMVALPFAAGLSIVEAPPAAKTHGHAPSIEELDSIELPDYGLAPKTNSSNRRAISIQTERHVQNARPQTSQTPGDVEASPPATPTTADATGIVPSFFYPSMNKWRVLAACLTYLGNGINDSAPGALIPYMESHYHIGYAVVSLIFVTNAVGFIAAAFVNNAIAERFGRARTLMLSEILMITGYTVIACTPPYPAVVMAYLLLGFGYALNLSLNNVFCANLAKSTVILGAAHGSYGIGGILAPIIATAMVSRGILWSRFFTITIGLRLICFFFTGWAFWKYEKEGVALFNNSLEEVASRQTSEVGRPTKLQVFGMAIKKRTTLIGALFIFAYQGAEVSESGWFISFLINYRNGDPAKVGYVTAGECRRLGTLGSSELTEFRLLGWHYTRALHTDSLRASHWRSQVCLCSWCRIYNLPDLGLVCTQRYRRRR